MTSKRIKIEAEIEKNRNLANWQQVREDVALLSEKVGKKDATVVLVQCECDFEIELIKGKKANYDIVGTLESMQFSTTSKFNVQLESKLLLGRILFHRKQFEKTLDVLGRINLTPERPGAPYLARLTAQACSAKALSQGKAPSSSFVNLSSTAQNEQLIQLFTKAADETVHFFKLYAEFVKQFRHTMQDLPISPTTESIFKRLPKLYFKEKEAIGCYRKYLTQIDARLAPHVKAQLAHDCATLILLTSTKANYSAISRKGQKNDIFVPETIEQEAYLLLLIADTLHEYVIDRAPEHDKERLESLSHAANIIDLVTLCLSRVKQYHLLSKRIEKTLKYAYQHFHLTFQFALSLIQAGSFPRAFFILDECIEIEPGNNLPYMIAAKVAIEKLVDYKKGFSYLTHHECVKTHPKYHEYMAICYSLEANATRDTKRRGQASTSALEQFGQIARPSFNAHYRYALQLAKSNKINSAITHCKRALSLNPDFGQAFLLLQLLLTTQLKFVTALEGTKMGCQKWPDIIGLQLLLAKLHVHFGDDDSVMKHCQDWIVHFAGEKSKEELGQPMQPEFNDVLSEYTAYTQKTHGTEIIASSGNHESIFLAESNLTEMESIISNEKTRHERIMTPKSNMLINSWYYLGQLFVKLDKIDEANKCIAEIRSIASGSQSKIFFLHALIAERNSENELAIKLCLESLSINVQNGHALETLTRLYYVTDQLAKSEKCAREAIALRPNSCALWTQLGLILESMGEESSSCFVRAAELSQFQPLLDYDILSIH